MPNRILREGILRSQRVNSLSIDAELFYRRLHSVVDDYGRYHADPVLLRSAAYPLRIDKVTDAHIEKWIGECSRVGLLIVYQSAGASYLQVERFGQQIRAQKSKFPDPQTSEVVQTQEPPEARPRPVSRANGKHPIGDWMPAPEDIAFALASGCDETAARVAVASMRDWATAKSVVRANWSAQYRNWIRRRQQERSP